MQIFRQYKQLALIEFVALMALLCSISAFSIDAILPALPQISLALSVQNSNDVQLLIVAIMAGMGLSQLLYGPLCDFKGRKITLYLGMLLFFLGTLMCLLTTNLATMLFGRFIQGFGLGAPRVVGAALIRDTYSGSQMSRIMSLIMVTFIIVPMIAPIIGQWIVIFFNWQSIFIVIGVFAAIGTVWFALRQKETIDKSQQQVFSFISLKIAYQEVLSNKCVMACTLAQGLIFGAFLSYLVTSQATFSQVYGIIDAFPYYFAVFAFSFGLGSFVNSKLVVKFGMLTMLRFSCWLFACTSLILLICSILNQGSPPFILFLIFMIPTFFAMQVIFPNFNTLAMQPLGHLAGIGAGVIGFVANLIGVAYAAVISHNFSGSLLYFYVGYVLLAAVIAVCKHYIIKRQSAPIS